MSLERKIQDLNNDKNPYFLFFKSLHYKVDSSILKLIDFISENTKENINEVFFWENGINENNCLVIKESSILDIVCNLKFKPKHDWESGIPEKMFKKFFDLGFAYKQISKEDFAFRVKKYKTLHKAIEFKQKN